jgi:hypothetical protein
VVDAIGLGPVVPWAGSRIESGEHTCRYAGVMLAHAYLHQGSLIRYTPHTITVTLDLPAHAPWTLDPGPWTRLALHVLTNCSPWLPALRPADNSGNTVPTTQ